MVHLNDYCLIHIFQYLAPRDLVAVEKVSKQWQALARRYMWHFSEFRLSYEPILTKKADEYDFISPNDLLVMFECSTPQLTKVVIRAVSEVHYEYGSCRDQIYVLIGSLNKTYTYATQTTHFHYNKLVQILLKNAKKLERLELNCLCNATKEDWLHFFRKNENLKILKFHELECQSNPYTTHVLKKDDGEFPTKPNQITKLHIEMSQDSEVLQTLITDCGENITSLSVSLEDGSNISCKDETLFFIGKCKNLKKLKLEKFELATPVLSIYITLRCPLISYLELSEEFNFDDPEYEYGSSLHALVYNLPNLETLHLSEIWDFHGIASRSVKTLIIQYKKDPEYFYNPIIDGCPMSLGELWCRGLKDLPALKHLIYKENHHLGFIENEILFALSQIMMLLGQKVVDIFQCGNDKKRFRVKVFPFIINEPEKIFRITLDESCYQKVGMQLLQPELVQEWMPDVRVYER